MKILIRSLIPLILGLALIPGCSALNQVSSGSTIIQVTPLSCSDFETSVIEDFSGGSGNSSFRGSSAYSQQVDAQTYVTSNTVALSAVGFYLADLSQILLPANLWLEVRVSDNAGTSIADSYVARSLTVDAQLLASDYQPVTFDFTDVPILQAHVTYYLVLNADVPTTSVAFQYGSGAGAWISYDGGATFSSSAGIGINHFNHRVILDCE